MKSAATRLGSGDPYCSWSPIVDRPALQWPDGARVAVAVIVTLGQVESSPPPDVAIPAAAARVGPYPAVPDIHETSHHEYGARVGIFRVIDVLDRYGVKAMMAADVATLHGNPHVVDHARRRDWEFLGHGLTTSRMITAAMTEAAEREYIAAVLQATRVATGGEVAGWAGVEYGQSGATVRLLAELGVQFVCDWPNDDMPYQMEVPAGSMVSLPVNLDLDDVNFFRYKSMSPSRYEQFVLDTFEVLHREGGHSGRLLVLNLHPYVIGQPHRIRSLERALASITHRGGAWFATGSEIVAAYRDATASPA